MFRNKDWFEKLNCKKFTINNPLKPKKRWVNLKSKIFWQEIFLNKANQRLEKTLKVLKIMGFIKFIIGD